MASPMRPHPSGMAPPADRQASMAETMGSTAFGLAGVGAALVAARSLSLHAPACPFLTVTGIACPGCGMTRLASATAHGHLATAASTDPAGLALLAALATLALVYLVARVRNQPVTRALGRWWVPAGLLGLLGLHWVTTLATGGFVTT